MASRSNKKPVDRFTVPPHIEAEMVFIETELKRRNPQYMVKSELRRLKELTYFEAVLGLGEYVRMNPNFGTTGRDMVRLDFSEVHRSRSRYAKAVGEFRAIENMLEGIGQEALEEDQVGMVVECTGENVQLTPLETKAVEFVATQEGLTPEEVIRDALRYLLDKFEGMTPEEKQAFIEEYKKRLEED